MDDYTKEICAKHGVDTCTVTYMPKQPSGQQFGVFLHRNSDTPFHECQHGFGPSINDAVSAAVAAFSAPLTEAAE